MNSLYCYPKPDEANDYIKNMSLVWNTAGYNVNYINGYIHDAIQLSPENKVLVLNWFEDRISYSKLPFLEFFRSLIIISIWRFKFERIFHVEHNLVPHTRKGVFWYRCIKYFIKLLSTRTLSHRPLNNNLFIHHPEYIHGPDKSQSNTLVFEKYNLIFGQVSQYKGIPELLKVWPKGQNLLIAGKSKSVELTREVESIIDLRDLNVQWINSFIEKSELDSFIANSNAVILPHSDNAMVVSGALYHAASLGTPVLAKQSQFSSFAASEFSFARTFTSDDLEEHLNEAGQSDTSAIIKEFKSKCGVEVLAQKWKEVLL